MRSRTGIIMSEGRSKIHTSFVPWHHSHGLNMRSETSISGAKEEEISSLNLHNSEASENELNYIICCIPHVVHLDLSGTSCSDETLECIRKSCQELESLNVSFCQGITDRGIENLCVSKLSLKYLNVSHSGVEGFSIAIILNGMPSLECVKCDDELINLLYKIGTNKQYNIAELIYDESFLDDPLEVIRDIAKMCPNLKKLHFEHPVSETVLKACVNFKKLEELKIKMSHAHDLVRVDVLTPILPLSKTLKTLILSCLEISALTLIESFKNLENLYLKKVSFTSFDKKDVKVTKTNLTTLVIKDIDMKVNGVNYEAISLLISLSKNVTKLHLNHIKHLPSEIFDVILPIKNLTLVNFEYTCIKIYSLNQLCEIPSLVTLMANCYENQEEYSPCSLFSKRAPCRCTLSWRSMYDYDEDSEDGDHSFDNVDNCNRKYRYDCDDDNENDIISDQCSCTDSESDDRSCRIASAYWGRL